jgi:hypothetical protein
MFAKTLLTSPIYRIFPPDFEVIRANDGAPAAQHPARQTPGSDLSIG